ncbi:ABC transporter permease [Paraburkholderia sp. UYCP14C]|uniref:ABC transporter permease n=1 Tax=Paraburkholderia sp. UYCP14C TaxID=2511130 RepID=UPI00101F4AA0|nr:ABC transporter permease [Paraburkholderia sp. UYCP14C]RZF29784.1 ABC transporter permease [Paraburkholderia sp. UYCP14C]
MSEISTAITSGQRRRASAIVSRVLSYPAAYIGTAALAVYALVAQPNLLNPLLLMLILRQAAPLGIAVLGQSICIRLLSLDLSFGGVAMLTSYVLTSGLLPLPAPALITLCLLMGVAVGAINAFFIAQLRASSVIVTLAMVLILGGVATAFSQLRAPGDAPDLLVVIGQARIGGVPVPVLVWLALLIPLAVFLRTSVFGRYVNAIGASPRAALASGLPYKKVIFAAHIVSSVLAVVSALLILGVTGMGSLDIGTDLALNSLASVILGGVTFGSGKGGVVGPAVAAFMLMFCFNLLTSLGLGEPGKQMVQGAIIALAAIIYAANGAKQRA